MLPALTALTSRSTESLSLGKCSAVPQHNKHFFFFLLGKEEKNTCTIIEPIFEILASQFAKRSSMVSQLPHLSS